MNKNKFIENFFSLTLLRGITLVVPLITFPYLIRVLGSENYGLVMWAWSIVNFFIIFINFGFDLSVTKYVSINRENLSKLSEIVSTTFAVKLFLFFISMLVFSFLVLYVPKMHSHLLLFWLTFVMAFGETLMPVWYFQGLEKMKYTAIITSFIKIFFTILVLIVIKKPDDYIKVPVLYAFSSIISGLFAYYIIFFKDNISFVKPKISNMIFYIKDSVALFLSGSISMLKDSITLIFIERYLGLSAVGYFDIAQKFVNILITPFHILSSVIYPHMAKVKDKSFLKSVIIKSTIIAVLIYMIIFIFSDSISSLLYGHHDTTHTNLILILSLSFIIANASSLLGTNGLVVFGKNRELFLSSLYSMLFYILSLAIVVISGNVYLNIVAMIAVLYYCIEMIFKYRYFRVCK